MMSIDLRYLTSLDKGYFPDKFSEICCDSTIDNCNNLRSTSLLSNCSNVNENIVMNLKETVV